MNRLKVLWFTAMTDNRKSLCFFHFHSVLMGLLVLGSASCIFSCFEVCIIIIKDCHFLQFCFHKKRYDHHEIQQILKYILTFLVLCAICKQRVGFPYSYMFLFLKQQKSQTIFVISF